MFKCFFKGQNLKLKVQRFFFSETWQKRRLSFELWALEELAKIVGCRFNWPGDRIYTVLQWVQCMIIKVLVNDRLLFKKDYTDQYTMNLERGTSQVHVRRTSHWAMRVTLQHIRLPSWDSLFIFESLSIVSGCSIPVTSFGLICTTRRGGLNSTWVR